MRKLYTTISLKITYLLCLFVLIIISPVFSQTSMLDVTFGNGGKVVTPVNDTSTANDVAIQPDGKIVVGGSSTLSGTRYFTLVRYNTDGSLDNSFGSGGKVINQIGILSAVNHIALRSDGKIIAGGVFIL